MLVQAVARKRCASCERWSGERSPADHGQGVAIASELATGLCQGGPWDQSERRARSACGHWRCWSALVAAPADGPAP